MTVEDDPFAALAAEQISNPVKAQMRAAKTREERRRAKAADDKQVLHQLWYSWHVRQTMQLMRGKHGKHVSIVADFLERMTIEDGGELVSLIKYGPWRHTDAETRYLLLGLIGSRILYLRRAEGLPPFDDSLPYSDEDPTVFELIRENLNVDR